MKNNETIDLSNRVLGSWSATFTHDVPGNTWGRPLLEAPPSNARAVMSGFKAWKAQKKHEPQVRTGIFA